MLELLAGPSVPYDPSYRLLWRPDRVAALARAFRADVLEVHSPYVAALGALATPRDAYGIRTLVWHSDHVGTYLDPWLPAALTAPLWAGIRALTRRFAATFVASRTQLERLRAHGGERLVYLPLGVDRARFVPRPHPIAKRVVAAGRMAIEKRWDVVIRAFAEAARPGWTLLALGDGPERPALERLARQLLPAERVQFAGFVDDRDAMAAQLADADIFLHGCPSETFGLSVAEALACGLTAVVPTEGGAGEWIDGARVRGYSGGSVAGAAAALAALMDLAEPSRLPMPEIPSIAAYFERQLACYDELLQGAKQAA